MTSVIAGLVVLSLLCSLSLGAWAPLSDFVIFTSDVAGPKAGLLSTLDHLVSNRPDLLVIPEDINNVGGTAVLFLQVGEFFVEALVGLGPPLTVLGLEDVVLGIVHNILGEAGLASY